MCQQRVPSAGRIMPSQNRVHMTADAKKLLRASQKTVGDELGALSPFHPKPAIVNAEGIDSRKLEDIKPRRSPEQPAAIRVFDPDGRAFLNAEAEDPRHPEA